LALALIEVIKKLIVVMNFAIADIPAPFVLEFENTTDCAIEMPVGMKNQHV